MSRRNRNRGKQNKTIAPETPAQASRVPINPETLNRLSMSALRYKPVTSPTSFQDFAPSYSGGASMPSPSNVTVGYPVNRGGRSGSPTQIAPFVERGAGRPKKDVGDRQTLPVTEEGRVVTGGWSQANFIIKRPEPVEYSFENLKWSETDLYKVIPIAKKISPDLAMAEHLIKRLCNTGLNVSIKEFSGDGKEATKEDPVATQIIKEILEKAGQQVASDIPGCHGGLSAFLDQLFSDGFLLGAMAGELVLTKDRRNVYGIVTINPYTIQLRRDTVNLGQLLIGQRRWDAPNGWLQLNPNLVCYRAMNGELYGDSEFQAALQLIPLWMGYFGKLQIFLHRAAFGFLDGVVKVEILQQMWNQVEGAVRELYDNDFMSWANAMVEYLSQCYKEQGETDPDAIMAHLDILEVKGEATGKATFPISEAQHVVKSEIYTGLKTPGELLGEKSSSNDKFTAMKVESYHAYLKFLQGKVLEIVNRFATISLQVMGYGKKVKADITFNPIPIDDRLTSAQALQLEQLCAKFLRDENLISQNAMARQLIGGPAIGPAPLSKSKDQDGASAPDPALTNPTPNPADKSGKAAAGGPASGGKGSYGGAKQTRDANPSKDKKVK